MMGFGALCLVLLGLLAGSAYGQSCSLITSNVLRVDIEETVLVDGHGTAFDGDIIVQDFPKKKSIIAQGRISVNQGNGFLGTTKFLVPSTNLDRDPEKKQFVYVIVRSSPCNLEKVVLVSYQSGYIFMQTDKPIYTPGSHVLYRIYGMDLDLNPKNYSVVIEVRNPGNAIVKRDVIPQTDGIISSKYILNYFASLGIWTLAAKFENAITYSFTTNFEVKEYALPVFDVNIRAEKTFYYIQDNEFKIEIHANYINGKPVEGAAYVLFSVMKTGEKKSLPNSLRRIAIKDGEGSAALNRQDLVKHFQQEEDMLQWSLGVSATVITESGSEKVETELNDIPIVTSLYKVVFTKTSSFFKPGLPMDLMIIVSDPNGTPVHRVPVVAEPGMIRGITREDGTVRLTINTSSDVNTLIITVKTTDPRLSDTKQASASITATAYRPVGGNYLHLRFAYGEPKVGENIAIDFVTRNTNLAIQNQITHFNYIILTKGRIVRTGAQERSKGQSLVTLQLQITPDFIPSFRIVAYYMVSDGSNREIVADSLWIDVADTCMGTLTLSGDKERDKAVQHPGTSMKLKLRADHKASVALVAVDKGVYTMNNKLKMSQTKFWDTVEKYNTGCTVGGGADAAGVFYDAGLALVNNFHGSTPQRSEVFCQLNLKRRRRDATIQTRNKRDDEDLEFIDSSDIITRTDFYQSWLWRIMTMNEAPDANGVSSKSFSIFLKDSVTTWEVLAVSLSDNKGICVSKPYDIRVMLPFSIDLQLPYAVIRNEQVEIRAILYNYGNSDLRARVEWPYKEAFCSLSTAKSNYQQVVTVKSSSSLAIPFVIVPLTLGDYDVEVKVAGMQTSDGVKKKLKVMSEGKLVAQNLSDIILDPEGRGRDGVQEEVVKVGNIEGIDRGTDREIVVTIQGAVSNQLVDKVIDGRNMSHLIVTPFGHGETVIMALTSNVICAYYLDATHQWEKVGVQRRTEAIQQINDGLKKLLAFRKQDGSWLSSISSTFFNAYLVKVFALAQTLITIEQNLLCDSVKWLILERQKPNGFFQESNPTYPEELAGGLKKATAELDYTFTAFVLIALLESEESCSGNVNQLENSIQKSTEYIVQQYPNVKTPYSIAITSYALARAGNLSSTDKLMSACTDNNHWEEPGSRDVTLEATSYGLLTLVKMKEYDKAARVVEWLIEQKFYGQTQRSTQSTIMVFQSMAQYYLDAPLHKDLDMTITLNVNHLLKNIVIRLTNQNPKYVHSHPMIFGGDFVATATGKGQGLLSVVSLHYARETEKERPCNHFDLSLKVQNIPLAKAPEGTIATVSLIICTRYLKSQDSGMAILQVSMMTGFAVDINDLQLLKSGVDRYISNFELNKGAFDKSTLVLYIDKISHTEEQCLKFNLHQYFKVGLIQPASVTVYEYHLPENHCTKFYHVDEQRILLPKICKGDVCRCAEANCFQQQHLEKVDEKVRLSRVCEDSIDYAYKTTLIEIKEEDNYFTYAMNVTVIIKQGMDIVKENQKRNFISHLKCHETLNLEVGRDYLVWGEPKDLWNLDSEYFYMVTKDTWIEMWPKKKECEKSDYETLCEELNNLLHKLTNFGCP